MWQVGNIPRSTFCSVHLPGEQGATALAPVPVCECRVASATVRVARTCWPSQAWAQQQLGVPRLSLAVSSSVSTQEQPPSVHWVQLWHILVCCHDPDWLSGALEDSLRWIHALVPNRETTQSGCHGRHGSAVASSCASTTPERALCHPIAQVLPPLPPENRAPAVWGSAAARSPPGPEFTSCTCGVSA